MKVSPNFKREEFACKCGCGFDTVDAQLLGLAELIRNHIGAFSPSSACRCVDWNRKESGSTKSQHLYGRAMDVYCDDPIEVYTWLDEQFPTTLGLGLYTWGIHVDTRTKAPARWKG